MATHISPLACVDPRAELGEDVQIGPFCFVGPDAQIGDGTVLDHRVTVVGHTTIGRGNRFYPNVVIGCEPQDLGYQGSPTKTIIGDFNVFREGVTVHRGAEKEDGITRIDHYNTLMTNSHVGHNCHVYNRVMLVNGVQLGGHVHVYDFATVSGNTCVHQFCSVGTMAYVGGCSKVTVDVPPYMLSTGNDDHKIFNVNIVGLQRKGIPSDVIALLKQAHRLLYRKLQSTAAVRAKFDADLNGNWPSELHTLLDFLDQQTLGQNGRAREAVRRRAA